MLDTAQREQFDRDGFLLLTGVFDEDQVARLKRSAAAIVDDFDIDRHRTVFKTTDRDAGRDDYFFDSAEAVHCFLEEEALGPEGELRKPKAQAINKIGHALHDLVPGFTEFCRQPAIVQALRELGQARPVLWQTMYIYKQPRIGGEVRWHQDASYLHAERPGVIGLWIALEDADRSNGCLWMAPGAHRSPLREIYEVDWRTRRGSLRQLDGTPWPGPDQAVALEAPAGSLVLFHDHMPHYSSPNRSERSRQAFTLHCSDAGTGWSPANWLQRPRLGRFALAPE